MPAKSEKQLKYIYYLKNKYKTKSKAPKKYKQAFEPEQTHIKSFEQFNGE